MRAVEAGAPIPSGSLLVRVVFGAMRDGALERVPRGTVLVRLPGGSEIAVPVDLDGAARLEHLQPGRYTVSHVPPVDATLRGAALVQDVSVTPGRETPAEIPAAYQPRGLRVVQLGSGAPGQRPGAVGGGTAEQPQMPAEPRSCGRSDGERSGIVRDGLHRGVVVPEMVETEVVCVLGGPAVRRVMGEWTYLFYGRTCAPARICDYDDVVFLHREHVVTAYLRGGGRRYDGPAPNVALPRTFGR